jgi:hypothetical protein
MASPNYFVLSPERLTPTLAEFFSKLISVPENFVICNPEKRDIEAGAVFLFLLVPLYLVGHSMNTTIYFYA